MFSTDFLDKVLIAAIGPILTVIIALAFGQRISAFWSERQKRRELELALAGSFYSSYGDFCAIWKEWNWCCVTLQRTDASAFAVHKLNILERACKAEGVMESVLLKISAERRLSQTAAADLGSLRQAYQVLRERVEQGVRLSYGASDHPDYLEFKRLATFLGNILATRGAALPEPAEAFRNFQEITDNRHERRWKNAGLRG